MTIYTFANKKGGVAKTTSSVYFAQVLHDAGKKVTGVDTDPEMGFSLWAEHAEVPYTVIRADAKNFESVVESIDGDIVIDTPPNDSNMIMIAGAVSDEVIVPLAPTGPDYTRLVNTLQILARIEKMRQKFDLTSVLLTKVRPRLVVAREAEEAILNAGFPLMDARIKLATAYESGGYPVFTEEYRLVAEELKAIPKQTKKKGRAA